ncbi:hypothetical protein Tco_0363443 [Tanacetum coccineum]
MYFQQAIHKNVDNVLHDIIPKIASNATNDIIEDNLPKVLVEAVIKKRDTFQETVEEPVSDVNQVIPKDDSPELIEELQNVDKHVTMVYDHERMEATLRDMICNQFRNAKEYAYHLEQSTNYMENQIV